MTTCQDIRSQLSEFVDATLPARSRAAIETHLLTCAGCAAIADDLKQLRTAARGLGPIDPPDHIWLEIAGQVRLDRASENGAALHDRPPRHPVWQWIGLAAALVIVTVSVYLFQRIGQLPRSGSRTAATGPGNAEAVGSVETFEQELKQAEEHYDKAIAELEAITRNSDGAIDPEVARTLQKNLSTIDRAIADSRAALNTNPESEPARDSLFEALRRKVGVLQATVTLMNEMRNGNQDGAARAAAGIGKS